jgi:hypothetical protein
MFAIENSSAPSTMPRRRVSIVVLRLVVVRYCIGAQSVVDAPLPRRRVSNAGGRRQCVRVGECRVNMHRTSLFFAFRKRIEHGKVPTAVGTML